MSATWNRISDILIRWRVWFVNLILAGAIYLPDILNAPEIVAIIPQHAQKYVFAAVFLLNIAMRPRAASRAQDADVQVRKAVKQAEKEGTAPVITVHADGETKAVITPAVKL